VSDNDFENMNSLFFRYHPITSYLALTTLDFLLSKHLTSLSDFTTLCFHVIYSSRGSHYFQIRGGSDFSFRELQGEVGDSREKWGDFWEKLIAIIRNIVSRPL
jgi:hypothetical protein